MLYVHCTHIINKSKMLLAGQKRKHVHKTLRDKAEVLNLIEDAPPPHPCAFHFVEILFTY